MSSKETIEIDLDPKIVSDYFSASDDKLELACGLVTRCLSVKTNSFGMKMGLDTTNQRKPFPKDAQVGAVLDLMITRSDGGKEVPIYGMHIIKPVMFCDGKSKFSSLCFGDHMEILSLSLDTHENNSRLIELHIANEEPDPDALVPFLTKFDFEGYSIYVWLELTDSLFLLSKYFSSKILFRRIINKIAETGSMDMLLDRYEIFIYRALRRVSEGKHDAIW